MLIDDEVQSSHGRVGHRVDWLRHQNSIPFCKSVTPSWLRATSSSFSFDIIIHDNAGHLAFRTTRRGELPTNRVPATGHKFASTARIPPDEILVKSKLLLSTFASSYALQEPPYPRNRPLSDHTSSFSMEPIVGSQHANQ
jgi:hypothetical protein